MGLGRHLRPDSRGRLSWRKGTGWLRDGTLLEALAWRTHVNLGTFSEPRAILLQPFRSKSVRIGVETHNDRRSVLARLPEFAFRYRDWELSGYGFNRARRDGLWGNISRCRSWRWR